jgi:hypothetical protein
VQQSLEETLGSRTIPSVLHKDVQHLTVLVYCTPKVVQYTSGTNEHFVQVPRVSGLRPPSAQSPGKVGAELPAPVSDTPVDNHHPTLRQDQLDVAQTETEDMIQPHSVTDDRGWELMSRK